MAPEPLPAELPSKFFTLSPNISIAYPEILKLEKSGNQKNVMYARILGYLLLYGPSDEARRAVAEEVVSCVNEDQLANSGKFYFDHFICAFKKLKECTPATSSHPSPPSFNELELTSLLNESPKSHEAAKQLALFRDGYHCLVTGNYEYSVAECNPKLNQEALAAGALTVSTHCAHIFDSATNLNLDDEGSDKCGHASSVWAVMDRFGYKDILDNLNGNKIHCLDNVLTFDLNTCELFNQLEIWFEPTGEQHKYRLATAPGLLYKLKKLVEFTTPDPNKYPLPSPLYLHIHATCAKIAHLSGAGEYIDRILMDLEDNTTGKVLSKDGDSAELLNYLLLHGVMTL